MALRVHDERNEEELCPKRRLHRIPQNRTGTGNGCSWVDKDRGLVERYSRPLKVSSVLYHRFNNISTSHEYKCSETLTLISHMTPIETPGPLEVLNQRSETDE